MGHKYSYPYDSTTCYWIDFLAHYLSDFVTTYTVIYKYSNAKDKIIVFSAPYDLELP